MHWKKYWIVIRNAWDEMFTYRVAFIVWRIQNILQLLTTYFLWLALLPKGKTFGSYNQSLMLTYVLLTSLVSTIVWSSKTIQIGEDINEGNLSTFLMRPIGYMQYWFAKDLGDKAMNTIFSLVEITILILLLRPPLVLQTNIFYIFPFMLALFLALVLYFFINISLGFIAFWSPETWAPRFIFFTIVTFIAGGLFPLDIMPKTIYNISQVLPFQYMLYFPIKIYLGQLSQFEIIKGLTISFIWVLIIYRFVAFIWSKGLKAYTAHGQ